MNKIHAGWTIFHRMVIMVYDIIYINEPYYNNILIFFIYFDIRSKMLLLSNFYKLGCSHSRSCSRKPVHAFDVHELGSNPCVPLPYRYPTSQTVVHPITASIPTTIQTTTHPGTTPLRYSNPDNSALVAAKR